jgi:lysozyme
MDKDKLLQDLIQYEGLKLKPYVDTVGKRTIGIGRNLYDVGISEVEAKMLCFNDIDRTISLLNNYLPWWQKLDDNRQRALCNMCFNVGISNLLNFKKMLAYLEQGNYLQASLEALNSKWATQVGKRAQDIAKILKEG